MPAFLTAKNLKPFISSELEVTSSQIEFRTERGVKAFGYLAGVTRAFGQFFWYPCNIDALASSREPKRRPPYSNWPTTSQRGVDIKYKLRVSVVEIICCALCKWPHPNYIGYNYTTGSDRCDYRETAAACRSNQLALLCRRERVR